MKNSKKNSEVNTRSRRMVPCISSAVGAQVPDYLAERLDDGQTEVVENHLLDCKYCREMYLTIIRVREAGRRRRLAANRNGQDTMPDVESQDLVDQET